MLQTRSLYLQWVSSEVVVGGVLIVLSVVQNFVAVNGPLACDPLVEFFIEDWLFGKLIGDIVLSGDFVGGLLRVDLVLDVDVVGVTGWSTKRSDLVLSCEK